jgi:hypothetical protein
LSAASNNPSSSRVIPLSPPQPHHDPHTEEISRETEATDGEGPKVRKIGGKRRESSNTEKGMIITFFVIFGVIATVFTIIGAPGPL